MKKIYLVVLSVLFFAATGVAQVVQLIPPADGGFENATSTLAANGWTAVASGGVNNWTVGSAAGAVSPTKAAYVSPDGIAYQYTSVTATAHFYRDLIVPAGATFITLTFQLKGAGQAGADRLLVYTAPTTTTPVGGALPAPATLVYTQSAVFAAYTLQTVNLPNTLAGTTVRLIFTWQQNPGVVNPPAAIDDVSFTYETPAPPTITTFSPNNACLGNTPTVTITGTHFGATSSVKFNGVNATSFIIVNSTTITAVLPSSGVTTGPISVTTPQGTATSGTDFTVNPPATTALTYTDLSPAYCVGTAITNNNPTPTGGTPASYSVSPALPGGLSIDGTTGIISGTPTAAATGTYTVTANNTCGSASVNLDITVTTPLTSVSYGTNPAIYCASVAITPNTPAPVGGTSNSYSVSPALPSGLSLNTLTGVITGTPTTTGGVAAANYRVTAVNSCSSVFVDVNITISPEKPVAPGPITGAASQCPAHAGQVYSIASPVPNATTYTWLLPPGWNITAGAGTISITVTTGAVGQNGNITVTADNSCGQSPQSILAVTVDATPTATAGGPDVVCESGTPAAITLTGASISGGGSGAWSLGTGGGVLSSTASTTTPATVTFSPDANVFGSATIILTPDVAPGCPGAAGVTRNITINQSASIVQGGEDNICQSASPVPYTLVGASFSGSATTAAWSITSGGGALSSTAQTPTPATVTYTPVANMAYVALLALTTNDPDGGGPCQAATLTRVVNINAGPAITSVTPVPTTICGSGSSIITVVAPPSGGSDILTSENFNGTPTFVAAGSSAGLNAGSIFTKRANGYTAPFIAGAFTPGSAFMLTNMAAIIIGTTSSTLTSPGVTTVNYSSLTLTFRHTYKPGPGTNVARVEVSVNGGAYTTVKSYAAAVGTQAVFANETIDFTPYINATTLKFRFNYSASIPIFSSGTSWWGIDDVVLTGIANTYKYSWTAVPAGVTAGLPPGAGTPSLTGNNPITVTPTVTTDYTVTETNFSSCPTTRTVTVTVGGGSAAPTGATAVPSTVCTGSSTTLTLTGGGGGGVGEIVKWYTGACGGFGSTLIGTGNPFVVLLPPVGTTIYYGRYESSTCPSFNTTCQQVTVTVGATPGTWLGKTTDWNDGQNWCTGTPPTSATNVTIPVTANNPIVSTAVAQAQNLTINAGATLTVTGNTLQVSRNIANSGTFIATNGAVEFNGTGAQTTATAAFSTGTVMDLVSSNPASLTIAVPLNVTGSLTFGPGNSILNTNGNLTLKSTSTGTAGVGSMAAGQTINGDVTVERWIGAGVNHGKSWQLLAIPTDGPTGQTIKAAWQEGAGAPNADPKPGYGTMLTSDVATATSQPLPGFDALTTVGPSMKIYNSATDTYSGPLNTGIPIFNQKGYFVLVRGPRSATTSGAMATPTVLRTRGRLFTPANPPLSTFVGGAQFESVGNPYASAIDLRNLTYGSGVNTSVYVWDPNIPGSYGLGIFQLLFKSGANYVNLLNSPGGYGAPNTPNNFIQSGQAFIIQGVGAGGTLAFKEGDKAPGSAQTLLRPQLPVDEKQSQLRANLYAVNTDGSTLLTDGALIQYNTAYTNTINEMDVSKMSNAAENLSVRSGGKYVMLERRQPISKSDTISYNLSGLMAHPYRFEFISNGLGGNGLDGFVEDIYLHTKTPLNMEGTTNIDFNVTDVAGSYAADRFRIVFTPSVALPVTFISVKAYLLNDNINVEWQVENESNVKQYEVEKSVDGNQFARAAVVPATANGGRSASYVSADGKPVEGINYYRVKSVDINGKTAYTNIVKVLMGRIRHDITIYPNPVEDGMIHLQFLNQPEGKYAIRLLNKLGQVIISRQISRADGSSTEMIKWDYKLAHGTYQLEVTKPGGEVKNINVLY